MKIKNYWLITMLEWCLLTVLSTCLAVSLGEGFFIPDAWNGTLLPALPVCAAASAFWVLVSYNRRSSLFGGIGFVAAGIICFVILAASSEKQSRVLLYLLIAVLTATVLFLLSRARIGCGVIIAGGCFVICGNAFLEYGSHPVLLCLYLPFSLILLTERSYRIRIRKVSSYSPSVLRHTASGVCCCLLAGALTGLSLCILLPAHLPTQELKLIRELVRMPVMEKIGTASTIALKDPDLYTDQENDQTDPTSQDGENLTEMDPSENLQDADAKSEKEQQELLNTGKEEKARAITYKRRKYGLLMLPAVLAALLAAAVYLKKRQRRLRLQRMEELEPQERMAAYYQYFLHMLSFVRLDDSPYETAREYSRKVKKRAMILFPEPSQFEKLSCDFERVYYGGETLTEEEWAQFQDISRKLPALCCSSIGKIRYLFVFFRT